MSMSDHEFTLFDRKEKIKSVVDKYGEENCCISFSGGKDSTVLSRIVDEALPGNSIPRVYANTGIELNMIRDFVFKLAESDSRVEIIKPQVPIIPTLEEYGYPFKSKEHSQRFREFKNSKEQLKHVERYLGRYKRPNESEEVMKRYMCPKALMYQFTDEFKENGLNISDMCCKKMKEEPLRNWQVKNHRLLTMTGIMKEEGGRRNNAPCLSSKPHGIVNFNPMSVVSKDFEEWFIAEYDVQICDIYRPPYNFPRTGCKGCPFNKDIQKELDVLETYFPEEKAQCEIIWKPVYEEYRRIGYRLNKIPVKTKDADYQR